MPTTRRSSSLVRRRSAIIRRDRQGLTWNELLQHIDTDPCFDVHTADGKFWIDPFTGKRAAAAKVDRAAALRHYFDSYPHWQKYPIKSIQELQFWRWVHYLNEHIRGEQRLRFFRSDGQWLNPFTGTWHEDVRRVEGRITSMTLHEMAKVLASTVSDGPAEMLHFQNLREIIEESHGRALRPAAAGKPPVTPDEAVQQAVAAASEAPSAEVAEAQVQAPAAADSDEQAQAPAAVDSDEQADASALDAKRQQRRKPGAETQRAQQVQSHLLGHVPTLEGYEFAVGYHPMDSVSGDFYDIRKLDEERLLMVVGDVSGHGVQAALAMATVLKSLRTITRTNSDLVEIACLLNDDVKPDLLSDQFVTMWFGILFIEERRLQCLSAGHTPAVIANPEGEWVLRRIMSKGAAIGMASSAQIRSTFQAQEVMLNPGDVVVQYTDGLSEVMDAQQEEFGDLRVLGSIASHLEAPQLQDVIDGVINTVSTWGEHEQSDDYTMVAMRVGVDGVS